MMGKNRNNKDNLDDSSTGSYLRDIRDIPTKSWKETRALFEEYAKTHDNDVRDEIAGSNLRLVVNVAKSFGRHFDNIELGDLIAEGNIGLLTAIDRFDVSRGFKFSTYAVPWIKVFMRRFITSQSYLPGGTFTKRGQIHRADTVLTQKLHRKPTNDEIADTLDKISANEVNNLRDFNSTPISLDFQIHHDDGRTTTLGEEMPDESQNPMETAEKEIDGDMLENAMKRALPLRTIIFLQLYYGNNEENREFTTVEIAKLFHCSKQFVNYTILEAQDKLREELMEQPRV